MNSINWRNLRSFNNSQNEAFEELCCQLAEYELPPNTRFIRKGKPDAGVECFAILSDGNEWGWQAKYLLSMGNDQWKQFDKSVKTALEKHPRLVKYCVCLPLDMPDARIEGQDSLLEKWEKHVEKWAGWATAKGINVEFVYWGSYQIFERLTQEGHRGRLFFWFDQDLFSQEWFQNHLAEGIASAGPRYTPKIHVDLPVSQLFDGLGRTPDFFIRIKERVRDIRNAYHRISFQRLGAEFEPVATVLDNTQSILVKMLLDTDHSLTGAIEWQAIEKYLNWLIERCRACIAQIDHPKKTKKENKEKTNQGFNNLRYDIYRLTYKLNDLQEFIQSPEAQLSNKPYLFLRGEAGTGKTHLFCDVTSRRVNQQQPTLLIMGQRLTRGEPWGQIIQQLALPSTRTRDDLLGALETIAIARQAKAIIFIDALNETTDKGMWRDHLPAMIEAIARYPWIALAISVRTSYQDVIADSAFIDNKFIRHDHIGFTHHEYEATRIFFDYYGLVQPSIPLLVSEFQNPLFLKLLCQGLQGQGYTKIPEGGYGITAVFKLFINAADERLHQKHFADDINRPIIWKAIAKIAESMSSEKQDWLPIEIVDELLWQLPIVQRTQVPLLGFMLHEGVLIKNIRWDREQNEWCEGIQFAYEKFADHLIVNYLISHYIILESLEDIFSSGQPLEFIAQQSWHYQGWIDALCVQLPEEMGKELPDIAPSMADTEAVVQGFLHSLVWRDPKSITTVTGRHLNRYQQNSKKAQDTILSIYLTVAMNPNHPYNAKWLHKLLLENDMAKRDAKWSIFLHNQYGNESSVDRLVEWAWSSQDKSHILDESIELCGIALAWFLAAPNRFVRDRATKALVSLFSPRLHLLKNVLEQFLTADDLYVQERLLAVAYGCVLRSLNQDTINSLAQAIYDWVFREGKPPAHILLRDYARGVIEYALFLEIELDVVVEMIRPPYKSDWVEIPTEAEIEAYKRPLIPYNSSEKGWSYNRILHSIQEDDFARYVIGQDSNWLALGFDEKWQSPEQIADIFFRNLTPEQNRLWQQYHEAQQEYSEQLKPIIAKLSVEQLNDLIAYQTENDTFKDPPEAIAIIEMEAALFDAIGVQADTLYEKFLDSLSANTRQVFDDIVQPHLNNEYKMPSPPRYSVKDIQRWIIKRVFELGWTIERFDNFDRYNVHTNDRSSHKAERMGKKYQWLAYYEILARLADNFQFKHAYSNHQLNHRYVGPWQISHRNIDPSSTLKKTGSNDPRNVYANAWWFPAKFDVWDEPTDDVAWMHKNDNLPDPKNLIEIANPQDHSEWLSLGGFYSWKQPVPIEDQAFEKPKRDLWYLLNAYLVNKADMDELYYWAREADFYGRWMPESHEIYNQVFLGEFFWSPAYTYHNDPYQRAAGWIDSEEYNKAIPKPLMPLTDGYSKESGDYDCSLDEGISIVLPNHLLVREMGLRWQGVEGSYFDQSGALIAFDPTIADNGPSTLLIKRKPFTTFLKDNNYDVLWTLLGEKQLVGGLIHGEAWQGRMAFSGAYRIEEGLVRGHMTPKFRSLQTDSD